MKELIRDRCKEVAKEEVREEYMISNDTICRQVSNRQPQLVRFSQQHDVIVFVSGRKSSNGKALFEVCSSANPHTHFISDATELVNDWFENAQSVGICGATSTPMWLMEQVAEQVKRVG